MGFFDAFKNKSEGKAKGDKVIPWHILNSVDQLDDIVELSKQKSIGIFKHSTRCGISKMVLRGFERDYNFSEDKAQIFLLDLLSYREISNEISARFQVFHQSPQFIVIKDGKTVSFESHQNIQVSQLHA